MDQDPCYFTKLDVLSLRYKIVLKSQLTTDNGDTNFREERLGEEFRLYRGQREFIREKLMAFPCYVLYLGGSWLFCALFA